MQGIPQVVLIQLTPIQLKALITEAINENSLQTGGIVSSFTKYLTRKQAAAKLQMSLPTLDKLIKAGKLPSKRIGRHIRFLETDIDGLLSDSPFYQRA